MSAATLLLSPPFTAYNQKELTEKIRAGKYRRIPYRYSEELNSLLSKMLNVKVLVGTSPYISTFDTIPIF